MMIALEKRPDMTKLGKLTAICRPSGWWIAPENDRDRYVAGPFDTWAEVTAYLARLK